MKAHALNRLWRQRPDVRGRILHLYARRVFSYAGGARWGQMQDVEWVRRR